MRKIECRNSQGFPLFYANVHVNIIFLRIFWFKQCTTYAAALLNSIIAIFLALFRLICGYRLSTYLIDSIRYNRLSPQLVDHRGRHSSISRIARPLKLGFGIAFSISHLTCRKCARKLIFCKEITPWLNVRFFWYFFIFIDYSKKKNPANFLFLLFFIIHRSNRHLSGSVVNISSNCHQESRLGFESAYAPLFIRAAHSELTERTKRNEMVPSVTQLLNSERRCWNFPPGRSKFNSHYAVDSSVFVFPSPENLLSIFWFSALNQRSEPNQ